MVSRIFKELQDWWDKQVERFASQQAQLHHQSTKRIKEEILYAEPTSDQYEIF